MAARLVPSVEVVAVTHLKAHPEVEAIVDRRVGTELYAGTSPAVWLTLVTGSEPVRNHLVAQVVDVRCYGGSKFTADLLARTVHAAMHALPGVHAHGVVNAVQALTFPAWNPDDGFTPPRPRYVGSYVITLHP